MLHRVCLTPVYLTALPQSSERSLQAADHQGRCRGGCQNWKGHLGWRWSFTKQELPGQSSSCPVSPDPKGAIALRRENSCWTGEKASSAGCQGTDSNLRRTNCTKSLGRSCFPVVMTLSNQWERCCFNHLQLHCSLERWLMGSTWKSNCWTQDSKDENLGSFLKPQISLLCLAEQSKQHHFCIEQTTIQDGFNSRWLFTKKRGKRTLTELKEQTHKDYEDYEDRLLFFKKMSRGNLNTIFRPCQLPKSNCRFGMAASSLRNETASAAVLTLLSLPQDAKSGVYSLFQSTYDAFCEGWSFSSLVL